MSPNICQVLKKANTYRERRITKVWREESLIFDFPRNTGVILSNNNYASTLYKLF